MIYTAIGLIAAAALGGGYLLSLVLRGKQPPTAVPYIHGLLAVSGVVVLIVYSLKNPGAIASVVIFAIAAIGGLLMLYKNIKGEKFPKWLPVVHGVIALIGFIFLIGFALGY